MHGPAPVDCVNRTPKKCDDGKNSRLKHFVVKKGISTQFRMGRLMILYFQVLECDTYGLLLLHAAQILDFNISMFNVKMQKLKVRQN